MDYRDRPGNDALSAFKNWTWFPAFAGMSGLALLMGCSPEPNVWKPALTEGLIQCTFDAYGNEGVKAIEPLSVKLNNKNSFEVLNDPFDRGEFESRELIVNELAIILKYKFHEMMEIYSHQCQYKINRVDGTGSHTCMLAETDHFQLHYPYQVSCKHIVETKI